jgi:DNA-directed RNA polymerase specialized sigma24 family protein
VEARARRVLQGRLAPPATVDDALQTAALRALHRDRRFDTIDGWVNWTIEVAWHEAQIEWRRQARATPGEVPDLAGGRDPGEVIEARLALDAAKHGLDALRLNDRDAILMALDDRDDSDAPLTAREKMRRYRARQRLAALLERDWSIGTERHGSTP